MEATLEGISIGRQGGAVPRFRVRSACGTPKYTNYTPDYKGCLDYIFIEADKLRVDSVVPLTGEEELRKHVGLPNEVFPSDHLALVVNLIFTSEETQKTQNITKSRACAVGLASMHPHLYTSILVVAYQALTEKARQLKIVYPGQDLNNAHRGIATGKTAL
ncbi:hypothetical protein NQ318_020006 [Aromia moschata]|uniref:Uncharacterized protein n=1 Tax=Aromia moschata TaxID=1265417 RepID=A0AAV8ZBH7_9CUCU|nr:hypothetical protein NQ318_020006 [Aromia moschata]